MPNDNFTDEFDPRHIEGIVPGMRYTTAQAAEFLGCSRELVVKICNRSKFNHFGEIHPRHYADFSSGKKYSDSEVARHLNVSHTTIFNLRKCGEFEETPLHHVVRIPGWSIITFIKNYASAKTSTMQFISIGKCIRIPGWGIIEFKKSFTT